MIITLMMIIDLQIRMFCGLVGEPSYIAAAEPYYEVDYTLFSDKVKVLTTLFLKVYLPSGTIWRLAL